MSINMGFISLGIERKFIINLDDKEYLYGEVMSTLDTKEYLIYKNGEPIRYNEERFVEEFGPYIKMHLITFLRSVESNVILFEADETNAQILYDADLVLRKINDKKQSNPSLWGYKHTLMDMIERYNAVIGKNMKDNEIRNFQDEYERLVEIGYIRQRQD